MIDTPWRRSASRGFSLVEVMVALMIIGIGMLGVAKMQGLALSSTGASRSRALAAIEAASLAAAMQANRSYWSATGGTVPVAVTVATSAGTASLASATTAMQTALAQVAGSQCGSSMGTTFLSCYCTTGNSAPCTAAINMAASDLYDWAQNLANFLPNATAGVSCNPGDQPEDCTISINWNENTVALTSQQAANSTNNGSTVAVSYSLYVVP
jgi:type IV pilus assembly protein PilV